MEIKETKFFKLLYVVQGYICLAFVLFWHPFSNEKNELTGLMKHASMVATDFVGEVYLATRRY